MERTRHDPGRNMVFVSHANPEDNHFSRWLSLRLANEGFPVWCDLTKLLGGEDFWRDIENAIRERTIRFLFVLSKASNAKEGTLNELAVARAVAKEIQDFIIPLRVDDLAPDNVNIELKRLTFIDFSKGWTAGYNQLLEKLNKEDVARDARFTPNAVTQWWRGKYPATEGTTAVPDPHSSNLFEITSLPEILYIHSVEPVDRFDKYTYDFKVPTYKHGSGLITFADAEEMAAHLAAHDLRVSFTRDVGVEGFRNIGLEHPKIDRREAKAILSHLIRGSFERLAISKGLLPYEMANGHHCYWFRKDLVTDDKIFYLNSRGERKYRQIVGFKSLVSKPGEHRIRHWHFGIQARPVYWPILAMSVRCHVVFTENGALYSSTAKQHSCRRSQCKSWYNDDWLDRMVASMSFLSSDNGIRMPLSNNEQILLRHLPVEFESPVTYSLVEEQPEDDSPTPDDEEDDVEEEDDTP